MCSKPWWDCVDGPRGGTGPEVVDRQNLLVLIFGPSTDALLGFCHLIEESSFWASSPFLVSNQSQTEKGPDPGEFNSRFAVKLPFGKAERSKRN